VHLNIVEVRKPEIEAKLVAEKHCTAAGTPRCFPPRHEAGQCSRPCVWALKVFGCNCGGRLGGAEIARVEWYREGRVPLHTLRADIDFAWATAKTAYGTCGVKV